jgi:hypothetical protein
MINYVNDYHYTRKEFLIVRGWYNFSIKKLNKRVHITCNWIINLFYLKHLEFTLILWFLLLEAIIYHIYVMQQWSCIMTHRSFVEERDLEKMTN